MRRGASFLGTALTVLMVAGPAAAQPSIQVAGDQVLLTGISPGGRVALMATFRTDVKYHGISGTAVAELVDQDSDGAVTWQLDRALPSKYLVVAADITTGAWARKLSPVLDDGLGVSEPPLLVPASLGTTGLSAWTLPASWALTLVVRPGEGAWAGEIHEALADRTDGEPDGLATQGWANLTALSPAESAFSGEVREGDLLLAVGPANFDFWVRPSQGSSIGSATEGSR